MIRALIVIAAVWAIIAPASYGIIFAFVTHWSALVDLVIIFSCLGLALAAFKDVALTIWFAAFAIVLASAISGFFYHFQDYGESGPLPFEWLNSYFIDALPLLLIALLAKCFIPKKEAEQSVVE